MSDDENVPKAPQCILVVEDEILIRLLLCDILDDAGYDVIEASNAAEALDILARTSPDLIVSDVKMPGLLDGMELLALVKRLYPKLPVIITSGHFPATIALDAGADSFIPKPYERQPMLKVVSEALPIFG